MRMKQLHMRLENNLLWYRKWHESQHHKFVHYSVLLLALVFATGIILASSQSSAAGTTYYVSTTGNDSAAGTSAAPWRTLAKACNTVTTSGDTIHIKANAGGTYTESQQCNLAAGVNIEGEGKTNTIVKSSITGTWSVYMQLESNPGTNGNQSISNFTLDGQANTTGNASGTWYGIWIQGRNNVSVHDMKFMNFFASASLFAGHSTTNPTTWAGPFATGNSFYNNDGTNCAGIIPEAGWSGSGCLLIGGQDGMDIHHNNLNTTARPIERNGWPIKYWDNGFLKGVKIHHNTFIKSPFHSTQPFSPPNWDFAVEFFNVQGMEFNNNYVQGSVDINYIYKGPYAYGLWAHDNILDHATGNFTHFESGFIFEYKAEKVIVENNIINNKSVGISFNTRTPNNTGGYTFPCGVGGCSANIDNIIRNNVFSNIYSSGGTTSGLTFISEQGDDPYISNMQIYNNTFVAKASQPALFGLDFTSQPNGNVNGLHIRNNIFQGFSIGSIVNQAAQTQSNVVITHNDTWNTAAPTFAGSGVTMNNNLAANPLFVSLTDFHLQALSTLIDKGINVGLPFNGNAPDIGRWETGASAPDTIAPTVSTVSPANGSTGIAVGSDVMATFSEALSSASVTTTTASIAGVTSAVTLSGNVVTINPSANLAPDTLYTVTLMGGASGIKDLAGNALVSNYTFTFRTAPIANIPPTANAGANQTITLPTNSVSLSGSQSNDPDGNIVSYLWAKQSGSGTLSSTNTVNTTVTGLMQGPSVYRLTVTDNQGATGTATVTITVNAFVDTQAPTVSITSPTNGQTVSGNKTITVNVSDNVGVDHVDFYRSVKNGTQATVLMGAGNPANGHSYSWNTTTAGGNGNYKLAARAYDAAGNNTTSALISVIVDNTVSPGPDTTPPTVSITSPTSGQIVSSSITISANASDNINPPGVTKVEFYRGTTLIDTDTSAPWEVTWNTTTVADGSYSLTAKAFDGATPTPNTKVSTAVSVTVRNDVTPPPGGYATWNPNDKSPRVGLSNGNLTASRVSGNSGTVRATIGKSTGKWYWEVKLDTAADQFIGVAKPGASLSAVVGANAGGWSMVMDDGVKFHRGNQGFYGHSGANGDVIGVALDMDNKKITFYENCTPLDVAFSNLNGTVYPAWSSQYQASQGTANFGASTFACPVPDGFNPGVN